MKKVNGRTGKGQHQVKGVKVVTSRRFAEVNGIAVGSISHRLTKLRSEYPEHVYRFKDELPLYFDEFLAERIVESMNEHPVWPSKILNKAKYKKFCLKYSAILGNKVTETQKTGKVQADTSANAADIAAGEKEPVKTFVPESTEAEIQSLRNQLEAMSEQYASLRKKYEVLQDKYNTSVETFAEHLYNVAMRNDAVLSDDVYDHADNIISV